MNYIICFVLFTCTLGLSHADDPHSSLGCGISNLSEGVNDKQPQAVTAGNFPWFAAIYHLVNEPKASWRYVCGGTLITPKSVLTSATCIHHKTTDDIKVAFGKLKQDWNHVEENEIKRDVEEIWIHEGYVGAPSNYENNVGVLVLTSEVVNNFVCLASNADTLFASQNQPGYVVGWDHDNLPLDTEVPAPSDSLKYSRNSILEHSACANSLGSKKNFLALDAFCNGTELAFHKGGNSGSGLTFVSQGHHVLYGIVSTLLRTDKDYSVVTYTNVSYHYKWIEEHMNGNVILCRYQAPSSSIVERMSKF